MIIGSVVQLVRTLACHARGRQFESDQSRAPIYAGCIRAMVGILLGGQVKLLYRPMR